MVLTSQPINISHTVQLWNNYLSECNTVYLPILGPVYSRHHTFSSVLSDLLTHPSNQFLVYDKNRRWFEVPQESIISDEIYYIHESLFIPVINTFSGSFKLFCYSQDPLTDSLVSHIQNHYRFLMIRHKVTRLFLYSLLPTQTRFNLKTMCIYLKNNINDTQQLTNNNTLCAVMVFSELPSRVAATFESFSRGPDLEGFMFLWKKYLSWDKCFSPILCAVEDEHIVGAIGPLEVWHDPWDTPWLLPPYFGVEKHYRKNGVGSLLWQVAMQWAHNHRAQYTLVQNSPESPAARFYTYQHLTITTNTYISDIPL